jgi:Mrp family chromosome partitioning ATPase
MKSRYSHESLAREFRFLRTRIEADVPSPAILLVASATDRDGVDLTAHGLADALSNSEQSTVVVSTEGPAATPALLPVASKRPSETFAVVSFTADRIAKMSRPSVATLMQRLRSEFDYVVIESSEMATNAFGLLALSSADAVLVAFRSGRSESPADRTMIETLERSNAKLLGVVLLDEATILEHARRREAQRVNEWSSVGRPSTATEPLNLSLRAAKKSY